MYLTGGEGQGGGGAGVDITFGKTLRASKGHPERLSRGRIWQNGCFGRGGGVLVGVFGGCRAEGLGFGASGMRLFLLGVFRGLGA